MPIDEGDNELAKFLASRGVVGETGYNYQYDRPQGVYGSQDYLERTANLYSGDALRALWAEYLRANPEIRKTVKEQEFLRGFGLGGIAKKSTKKALTAKQAQLVASGLDTLDQSMARALTHYQDMEKARMADEQRIMQEQQAGLAKQHATSGLISGLLGQGDSENIYG